MHALGVFKKMRAHFHDTYVLLYTRLLVTLLLSLNFYGQCLTYSLQSAFTR